MNLKFKKVKDNLPNLAKRLRELEKVSPVEIGFFQELPDHPSGLSSASLYNILHNGSTKNSLPARPVFTIGMILKPINRNLHIKGWVKKYLSNIGKKNPPIKAEKVLGNVGGLYVQTFREVFGSSRLTTLSPSTISYKTRVGAPNPTAPLVLDGTLMSMVSYKVNGVIVTPP